MVCKVAFLSEKVRRKDTARNGLLCISVFQSSLFKVIFPVLFL